MTSEKKTAILVLKLNPFLIFVYLIGELISHMAIHAHGKPGGGLGDPTEFQCTYCHRRFIREHHLQAHLKSHADCTYLSQIKRIKMGK